MTQHHPMTADGVEHDDSRGFQIGRRISQILHPVPLSIVSIFLAGIGGSSDRSNGMWWALISTALQVVPMTIFFRIRLRQGAYSDEDVSIRTQRTELYLSGLVTLVIGLLVVVLFGGPQALAAMLLSAILINVVGFTINLFWKISVHSASIGTAAILGTFYLPPLGALLWALAAVLGWARVRTRNHTVLQVIAGISLAVACVLASFRFYGLI